ncbi:DUF1365 domain-containing protein [Actinomadura scrupuli]|uniref:DUF1365 domain-containing protein n=1 Tax=Actinomadura scrupuli TaxID=559629 RepID=UPI003D9649B0
MVNIYAARLVHVRRWPITRTFGHHLRWWLVDLDDLPALPWWLRPFARFRAADHLGDGDRTIRRNVESWLAERGIRLNGGRILMLAVPRVLGYSFNPLTLFWCHDRDGRLRCVVAEVSNTYGERYCYLLEPGPFGRARADKRLYVSPFLGGGRYLMWLPVPGDRLAIRITLVQDGRAVLTATLTGRRIRSDLAGMVGATLHRPLTPLWISLLIRGHGIRLWLRGLPTVPRPHSPPRRDHKEENRA